MPPKTKLTAENIRKYTDTKSCIAELFGPAIPLDKHQELPISVERIALETMAVGELLREGKSVEDILNPEKLQSERMAVKQRMADLYKLGNYGEFGSFAANSYNRVLNAMSDYYLSKIGPDSKAIDFLKPENRFLTAATTLLQDAGQQMEIIGGYYKPEEHPLEASLDEKLDRQTAINGNYRNVTMLLSNCAELLEGKKPVSDLAITAVATVLPYAAVMDVMQAKFWENPANMQKKEAADAISDTFGYAGAAITDPAYYVSLEPAMKTEASRRIFAEEILSGTLGPKILSWEGGALFAPISPENLQKTVENLVPERLTSVADATDAMSSIEYFGISYEERAELEKLPNPFSLSRERNAISALACFRMLKDHPEYDIDYVLSDAAALERAAYGKQAADAYRACSNAQNMSIEEAKAAQDVFGKYAAEGFYEGFQQFVDYVASRVDSVTEMENLALPENRNLLASIAFLTDAVQELRNKERVMEYARKLPGFDEARLTDMAKLQFSVNMNADHNKKALHHMNEILKGNQTPQQLAHIFTQDVIPSLGAAAAVRGKAKENPDFLKDINFASEGVMVTSGILDSMLAIQRKDAQRQVIEELFATPEKAREVIFDLMKTENQDLLFGANPESVNAGDFMQYFTDRDGLRMRRQLEAQLKQLGGDRLTLENLLHGSTLGNAEGEIYQPDKEAKETVTGALNRAVNDIRAGKEVYCFGRNAQTGKTVAYRLTEASGSLRFKEDKVIGAVDRNRAVDILNNLNEQVRATGVTSRDSAEFTAFRESCQMALDTIRTSLSQDTINKQMDQLRRSADAYYRAKVGEEKNARRRDRFDLAAKVRNLQLKAKKTETDLIKEQIAGKAVAAYCKALQASGNEDNLQIAAQVMTNRKNFDRVVSRVMESEPFISAYGNKALPQLKSAFAKSGSRLVMNLVHPEHVEEIFAPEHLQNNPQSGPQAK